MINVSSERVREKESYVMRKGVVEEDVEDMFDVVIGWTVFSRSAAATLIILIHAEPQKPT